VHKACLIRLCVGRTSSIPSGKEDYTSPPDGEIFFFFKARENKQVCARSLPVLVLISNFKQTQCSHQKRGKINS